MLHGPLAGKLLLFTLPIALSGMLQQLFNAADTAVVGHFADAGALAAAGTNTEIVALIVSLSSGLSIGANVLIADRIGSRRAEELPAIIQTTIILALLIGIAGMAAGLVSAEAVLHLIRTPEEIMAPAVLYLRIYLIGYPFLLLYDFGSAALRACGCSRYPFLALMISGLANIMLNLLFVLVFHMDVAGVALTTDISTLLSAVMVLRRLVKEPLFRLHLLLPGSAAERQTSKKISCFAAGAVDRCRRIHRLCLYLSLICSCLPIIVIVLLRTPFSGFFSSDASVIESSCTRILCILLFEPLCNLYEIPTGPFLYYITPFPSHGRPRSCS